MEEAQENTKMLTVDKEAKDIFKEEEKHQVLNEKNVRMEKLLSLLSLFTERLTVKIVERHLKI